MTLRRLALSAVSAAVLTGGLSACGEHHEVKIGETEGFYVTTGDIRYQVQISRVLNPADTEDRSYLIGLPEGERQLDKGEEFFAIFLKAQNRTDEPHPLATSMMIVDTQGNEYLPIKYENPLAYAFDGTLSPEKEPGDEIPDPNSVTAVSPTQGQLVLFKVKIGSFDNRPLELRIRNPRDFEDEAIVDLDI